MNEKMVQIVAKLEEPIVIPCVAYANPRPNYRYVNVYPAEHGVARNQAFLTKGIGIH